MGIRFIKSVVFVFVFCFTCSSYGSIELVIDDSNFDFFNQGSALNISIISQNESENFSMFLDVFKHDTGYVGELTDCRTGQVVSNFSLYSTGPIDPPDFILNNPTLDLAAGNLGSYNGPLSIINGYRFEFSREQSPGIAPNGVVGSVDLTVVPEPASLFLFGISSFLIRKFKA